jgi:hypothetical protein
VISLHGKRVLLVAPRYFGYERDILGEIERRGAAVDWLPDRPFDTPLMTALTKLKAEWLQPAANRVYDRLLGHFGTSSYDYILVVNGQTLSHRMLTRLRSSFPNANTILYMWDSIDNRCSVIDNLPLFDSAFSFDPQCARSHGMTLRPLFYSKGFEQPQVDFEYKISFIGTAHTDRYAVVSELNKRMPPDVNAFWYLYLQAPWVYQYYRATKPFMRGAKKEEFHFVPLDKTTVQSVFARSRAVLDIEHPKQRGLTIRTFETMGAQKKLVTTNKLIEDYDFFASGNVCVVDRMAPQLSKEFLETPFVPYTDEMLYRYSLAGWLDEVLGLNAKV